MTCPSCGSPGAYVGLAVVECDNAPCYFHKPIEIAPLKPSPSVQAYADLHAAMLKEVARHVFRDDLALPELPPSSMAWLAPISPKMRGWLGRKIQPNPGATDPAGKP